MRPELRVARLIPVTGIGNTAEAEQRATSVLLAVLTVVRDLSAALFDRFGAPGARRADVEAFTEVSFRRDGKKDRPDGLLRFSYGKKTWQALVEVKTKSDTLNADQINRYWDLAREAGYDAVVTISNEIAVEPGGHPTEGLKVQKNSPVKVFHLSWSEILTTAIRIREHTPVDDPEQAWILNELIRYLEHPASGALSFDDMGPHWVAVRSGAKEKTLTAHTEGIDDIVERWDQLVRFAALRLSSELGEDVRFYLTGKEKIDRAKLLKARLCDDGMLDATLRIPNTAGDLRIEADLRAGQLAASITVRAPEDRGARGRISWLVNQIRDASLDLAVESYPKNVKTPTTSALGEALEDRGVLLGDQRREPHRFRVTERVAMGLGRRSGRKSKSFIESVLHLIDGFYESVVQEIEEWRPPTPRRKQLPEDAEKIEAASTRTTLTGPPMGFDISR